MAHPTFRFEIITPERKLFSEDVIQVTLPTRLGEITVLAHHLPIVALLVPGEVRVLPAKGDDIFLAVSGGFIEVAGTKVTILADTAERAEELDEARAEEAKRRAEEAANRQHENVESQAAALAQLEKQLARLRAIRRHKRRQQGGSAS